MRYLCTLFASEKGRRTAEALNFAFAAEFGSTSNHLQLGNSAVVTAVQFPSRNSGVIRGEEAILVSPHMYHSTYGTALDLASPSAVQVLESFVDGSEDAAHAAPLVVMRATGDGLTIAQDFVGSARCFVYHDDDIAIATNALDSAESVVGSNVDWEAMASFASCGWVRGDHTFNRGFRVPSPGERIHFTVSDSGLRHNASGTRQLDHRPFSGMEIGDVAEQLEGVGRSIAGASNEQLRIGLSGGRDSRVMAALFLRAGADVTFNTTNNYDDETAIAQLLLREAGFKGLHKINEPSREVPVRVSPLESARALSRGSDGLFEPTYIGLRSPNTPDPFMAWERITISGAAGEMVHGHYYPPERSTAATLDRDFYVTHLLRRITSFSVATGESKEAFASELRKELADVPEFSDPVKILDHFYLYERQRRWSGVSAQSKTVAPMLIPPFALASFGFDTPAIRSNSVPRTLAATFMPAWKDIEYFGGGGPKKASNRPVFSQEDVDEIVEFVTSFDELRSVVDMSLLQALQSPNDIVPARRDALLKRSLALACIVERADAKPA